MDLLNLVIEYIVVPICAAVWLIYNKINAHHTDIEVLKATAAANKARNPGIFATLSGSAEEEAINAFSAQKKMQEYRRELETLIAFQYGPKGLEEYKDTLRAVREERRKTAYRQAEIKEAVTMWSIALLVGLSGLAGLALIAWAVGRSEGRWGHLNGWTSGASGRASSSRSTVWRSIARLNGSWRYQTLQTRNQPL